MGRFAKYTSSEFNPLIKLEPGEEFVRRVVGAHEYVSKNADDEGKPRVVVVLDFEEDSWRASAWHAAQELDRADPEDGDLVRVKRLADDGQSHRYSVEVVNEDDPVPAGDAPPAPDGEDIPF